MSCDKVQAEGDDDRVEVDESETSRLVRVVPGIMQEEE
jgi:hypothetical protein